MSRLLYRGLLWLHPPAFRRQFAVEMFGIFEDALAAEGAAALVLDGLVSLLRQWVLRSGLWKVATAGVGAGLQVVPALWMSTRRAGVPERLTVGTPIELDGFIVISCILVAFVALMVAATVVWATRVSRLQRLAARPR
jgi:hypothetical protein